MGNAKVLMRSSGRTIFSFAWWQKASGGKVLGTVPPNQNKLKLSLSGWGLTKVFCVQNDRSYYILRKQLIDKWQERHIKNTRRSEFRKRKDRPKCWSAKVTEMKIEIWKKLLSVQESSDIVYFWEKLESFTVLVSPWN